MYKPTLLCLDEPHGHSAAQVMPYSVLRPPARAHRLLHSTALTRASGWAAALGGSSWCLGKCTIPSLLIILLYMVFAIFAHCLVKRVAKILLCLKVGLELCERALQILRQLKNVDIDITARWRQMHVRLCSPRYDDV